MHEVYWFVLSIGGVLIAKEYLDYKLQVLSGYLSSLVAAEVREEAMAKYLGMSLAFFDKREAGDAVVRISGDSGSVWRLSQMICDLVRYPVVVAAAIGVIVAKNVVLGLVGLVGLPLAVPVVLALSKRVRKYSRRARRRVAEIAHSVVQVFSGMRIVIAYGQGDAEARRIGEISRQILHLGVESARSRAAARALTQILNGLGLVLVLIIGAYMMSRKLVKTGDIIGVGTALWVMYGPIKALVKDYGEMHEVLPNAERIFEVLDLEPDMKDAPDAVEMEGLRESIAFEDVSFRYDRDAVLEGISLTIPAGSTCAVVGPSGAGKSSLLNLVPRFYDPTSGRILVDGRDLRKLKMASLRRHIAIVTQDPFLFNTTIYENIRYGRPDATREEIEGAARAADMHDEIAAFPQCYETMVGERGLALSGGQRQRVAIARAILRGAPILILDEATSSLDSVSEREVQAAIDTLVRGRTTIVVAHRLSTVSGADMIVVLGSGRVEAAGRHEELLQRSPVYRELWEAQQHKEVEPVAETRHSGPLEALAESIRDRGDGEDGSPEDDEPDDEPDDKSDA
jgi:subfamily B ATP-binding cassette protein MsbA